MAMKAILTSSEWEALGDDFQAEYNERDGKYILDVTPTEGFALEDIGGLKTALSKERSNVRELNGKLTAFGDITPDLAKDAIETAKRKGGSKDVEEQVRSRTKQLEEKHSNELQEKDGKIGSYQKQLSELRIDSVATRALAEHKGSVELLLPHIRSRTRLREDGDKSFVDVVDKDGNARVSPKSGSSDPMTIDELVTEMRDSDTFAPAFTGSGASGSGSREGDEKPAGSGGSKVISSTDQEALSANLEDIASGKVTVDM